MTTRMRLALVLLLGTTPVAASSRLELRASPAVAMAPATLTVHATIEPDADNRELEIEADSPEFYRSSAVELDGARAPHVTTLEFHSLPPGVYAVTATLLGP